MSNCTVLSPRARTLTDSPVWTNISQLAYEHLHHLCSSSHNGTPSSCTQRVWCICSAFEVLPSRPTSYPTRTDSQGLLQNLDNLAIINVPQQKSARTWDHVLKSSSCFHHYRDSHVEASLEWTFFHCRTTWHSPIQAPSFTLPDNETLSHSLQITSLNLSVAPSIFNIVVGYSSFSPLELKREIL